jgi:hypothetical protein
MKDRGCTRLQWRTAAAVVQRVAMNMLLNVPARGVADVEKLAQWALYYGDKLPKAQQRRLAQRLARYFSVALAGDQRMGGK